MVGARMETKSQIHRFGPFEVNLRSGELRKRGFRLALQEQPLRILAALLERPGDIVSREDLCRRLWPHGTFVDFEHSLNAAVRRLRVTLGDDATTPRFVETVPRRGYRFITWGLGVSLGVNPTVMRSGTISRLAVLPFIYYANVQQHDLFSDGLTAEIVTQLARGCPPHVGVIARTSVVHLAGSDQTAAETGRVLGADYLLEGSVRREGHRVRIIAQLIESQMETHLWAGTYDRVHENGAHSLSLQAEVAEQIARAVADALSALRPPLSREAAS